MFSYLHRIFAVPFFLITAIASLAAQVDPDLLAGLKARSIGPATMSGRIAAIDAVESNPDVIYVGAATGGVWKSTNAGLTWAPVFDDQPVAAIGAVAIFQPSPDVIWVGTGEANPRNSASVGNGVYKSMDGGLTWTHLGLDQCERVSRIMLHPFDPDVAYVAAMGRAWGENEERGVFKTTDGGKTWKKVLYVDEKTGAADLVMDPSNPLKLIAAMWDYRRWPWFFRSGGPGSGIFLTYDGGETWKRRTEDDGLPKGDLGRMGLAIAPSDPKTAYAFVEAEEIGLYKSVDGGESWTLACSDPNVGNRPFYYADIRVDPKDANRVYSLWSIVSVSIDGGKTFDPLMDYSGVHPDHHALWIDPRDPTHLINGNDGGIYTSHDHGKSWWFARNLPLGQYYHIRVDMETPYNVYGGMQDNGSWKGPSSVWVSGGIRNFHWHELCYGDGFDTVPDPEDAMQGYAMSQEGHLVRWNLRTGEQKDIKPTSSTDEELRFHWNAGIAIDPFDRKTIYFGSQFVHKTSDRGTTWTVISPDLTTDNRSWQKQDESGGLTLDVTGAENFTTIIAIAPSPLKQGLLWVGTDDGRLHVTQNHGSTWTSLESRVKGVPANTWIPHIAPSHFDPGEAFVVFEDHRRSNWIPYVYKTTDFGMTWTPLSTEGISGYALVIEQDPVNRDLLYLGTEFGLYISLDHGKTWFKWTHGLPTVSVMDLCVHPREHDLVLATHGRSAFIIDDIRPLRELSEEVAKRPIHLFEPPPAQQYREGMAPSTRSAGTSEFRGENRSYGALITCWLNDPGLPHPDEEKERERKEKERSEGKKEKDGAEESGESGESGEDGDSDPDKKEKGTQLKVEIMDEEGKVIRTFEAAARQGMNRVVWDLRGDPFKRPTRPGQERRRRRGGGPEVLPGSYGVKVKFKDHEVQGKIAVLGDPRFDLSVEARTANFAYLMRTGTLQETLTEAVERIRKTREDVQAITARMKKPKDKKGPEETTEEDPAKKALLQSAKALKKKLDEIEALFVSTSEKQDITRTRNVSRKIGSAMRSVSSTWDAPTDVQKTLLAKAEQALEEALDALNRFMDGEVASFKKKVQEAGITLLPVGEPIKIKD